MLLGISGFELMLRSSAALDILTIDPKHQRRGAGAKLVEWGVQLADEMGVEVTIHRSINTCKR